MSKHGGMLVKGFMQFQVLLRYHCYNASVSLLLLQC